MKKLLVCEDEDAIREFEVLTLRRSGYEVVDTACGEDAIEAFNKAPNDFSVVLLDIMMPGIDGLTVCKKIREKNSRVGIIMLSAKTQEMDKVKGLMLGADDYVTKPFSPSELAARVDAICRRISVGSEMQSDVLTSGPFVLNMDGHTFTKNGKPIDLTQVEFQLMELFMRIAVAYLLVGSLQFEGLCIADVSAWVGAAVYLTIVYYHTMKKYAANPGTIPSVPSSGTP